MALAAAALATVAGPAGADRGGGTSTTYSAGSGLSLSSTNVFSVIGAPWAGLTGVPAGFSDGIDNIATWSTLTGVPSDLLDGDNDGSAAVSTLSTTLGQDDGVPDQSSDPVSFSKLKDLTTTAGDGRITGAFIRDHTVTGADLAAGAITGDKIADHSIEARHLAPGVLDRTVTTTPVDPPQIPAASRASIDVPVTGVGINDIVTVSPPALLADDLLFVGSDVRADGVVTIYLYNPTAGPIDDGAQTWTIRSLHTGGA